MEKISLKAILKEIKESHQNNSYQNSSKKDSKNKNNNKNSSLLKIKTPESKSSMRGFGQYFSCVA